MAKLLKLRRGTTTQHGSFTGAEGEVTVDTDKETLVVHDGSTAGGHPVAAEDMANVSSASIAGRLANDSIATSKLAAGSLPSDVTVASANLVDGTIVNADVNASAAIAGSKIDPDFGSQDITTTGRASIAHDLTITGTAPRVILTDTNNDDDFRINVDSGNFQIEDATNGNTDRLVINSSGTVNIPGNLDVGAGIDVTGNIEPTGNINIPDSSSGSAARARFGSGADLQIYHDGAHSKLVNDTGTLVLQSDAISLTNNAGNSNRITSHSSGEVKLFHSDSQKLVTTSSGIDVTGNIVVSGTVDGRDVASDGSKLDGIESGATADQTGQEIATALNGQSIYTTANIGRDSTDYFSFSNNTHLDLYINNSNEFRFENDGDFHADGDVIAQSTTISSDRKLKENIEVIPNALDKVLALNGVSFDWKKTGEKSAGVIAQEVQGVLPEAVKEVTPLKGGDSHLSVNYHALTSILIESIKELKAEIEELKGGK